MDTSDWEFPDVCQYYFGKVGQWSSLMFSMVSLVGAMVVYWVLMSNFLFNTGQFIYSKKQWFYLQKNGIMSFCTIVRHVNAYLFMLLYVQHSDFRDILSKNKTHSSASFN